MFIGIEGAYSSIAALDGLDRLPAFEHRGRAVVRNAKRAKVVIVEGDDASPEAVRPTVALLDSLGLDIEWLRPPIGTMAVAQGLPPFPDVARAAIDDSDATLFGSASALSVPALVYLRWGKETYANVRPCRYVPGYRSPLRAPEGIDFVMIRENTEDVYFGAEGDLADLDSIAIRSRFSGAPLSAGGRGHWALKVITQKASERVARFGFELARRRKAAGHPGCVVVATKYNVLPRTDGSFVECCESVAKEYPDLVFESLLADEVAHRLTLRPQSFDVMIVPNLYGDILSDLAAGVLGGLGLAPSGCYGENYAYFEAVHGTAPDLTHRNVINPTATVLSAKMMLEYLGFVDAARRLQRAVDQVYENGKSLTPDQGGMATTTDFCAAIAERLR